jgi:hypothetical protein
MAHSALVRKPGIVALMIAVAALWMSTAAVSVEQPKGRVPAPTMCRSSARTFSRGGAHCEMSQGA